MTALPRLRPLEILHLEEANEPRYLLRDPEGVSDEELILSEPAFFVAAHFDGVHTPEDLAVSFEARYGVRPDPAQVDHLATSFENAYFLETDLFFAHREELWQRFAALSAREPAHAGLSYPAEPDSAQVALHGFFEAAVALEEPGPRPEGRLRGLIAPHIDLRVGGPCTALAYRLLEESPAVRTVVVLGTAHGCGHAAWIPFDKPYLTPLGAVPVDEEALRRLAAGAGTGPSDLFHHRKEHSVEFQALFLAELRRRGRELNMVPVLCGSLRGAEAPAEPGEATAPPAPDPQADAFLCALKELLVERGEITVVLAAADLAHVGPRFGEADPLTAHQLERLKERDRDTLTRVTGGDGPGFFSSVMEAGDPRRICGLAPIFGLLASLPGARGKVLRYEQASDPSGTVSYASVGLWG